MATYVVPWQFLLLIAVSIFVLSNVEAKNLQASYQTLYTSPSSGSTTTTVPASGSSANNGAFITVDVAQLSKNPITRKELEANLVPLKLSGSSGGTGAGRGRPSINNPRSNTNDCAVGDVYYPNNPNCQRKIGELQDILLAEPNVAAVITKARELNDGKTYHPKAWSTALTTVSVTRKDMQGLEKPFPEDVLPNLLIGTPVTSSV